MNTFKNFEVVIPKFKSWDKGLRVKINEKYSVYNDWKPGHWFWKDDSPYWEVCLTSNIEEQFVFGFTKNMLFEEAVEFANYMYEKLKK